MAQKQHQFLVPVALLVAAVLIGGAVYFVTSQPSEARPPAWGGTPGAVPAPVPFAGTDQPISTYMATNVVPAGTDLAVAQAQGLIMPVSTTEGLWPPDALAVGTSLVGKIARTELTPQTLLTEANVGTTASFLGRLEITGSSAPCPTDWPAPPSAGTSNVFVVTAPIARGTSAAAAFRNGAIVLTAIPAKYAPVTAVGTLAEECEQVAAYDLTPGTVVHQGIFRRP